MKRDERLALISKKRRTGDTPSPKGEGSSKIVKTTFPPAVTKFKEDVVYKLYFKGLIKYKKATNESGNKTMTAGFGITICDQDDNLMFQFKDKVSDPYINGNVIELIALVRGIKESFDLGIRRIIITTDAYEVYQIITNKSKPKEEKVDQLMEEVRRIREKYAYSEAIRVPAKEIQYVLELAKDTLVPQSSCAKTKCLKTPIFYDIAEDGDYENYNPANGCGCPCNFYDDDKGFVDYVDYYTL